MKIRQGALLAIIGMILTIVARIWSVIHPTIKAQTIPGLINILGGVLTAVFFIAFYNEKKSTSLRGTAQTGIVAQVISICTIVLGIVNNRIMSMYMLERSGSSRLLFWVTIVGWANFILILTSIILMCIFFNNLYKYYSGNDILKKVSLLALLGQVLSLAMGLAVRALLIILPRIVYRAKETVDLIVGISKIEMVTEFITLAFLMIFFIVFYRFQENYIKD